jgi:hypothetical protein
MKNALNDPKQPLITRPNIADAEGVIPDVTPQGSDKSLRQIIEEVKAILKPYRKNLSIGIEMANDAPYIIRLNYEIFLK